MNRRDIDTAMEYFDSGRFPETELVIGLVGAVGTGLRKVAEDLTGLLQHYAYETQEIHVSEELIGSVVNVEPYEPTDEYDRISKLMNAGNIARMQSGNKAVLALGAAALISAKRELNDQRQPLFRGSRAYIINSLKRPEEVKVLKRIYGDGFFLIGVFSDLERRKSYLTDEKRISEPQALDLMQRDEDEEEKPSGQRTRNTFHLADFFLHLDANEDKRRKNIQRILHLIFGNRVKPPTFDEFAMFMAFSASLRSASLARQVGAVIANDKQEILATGANDCPRYGGGLYWPTRNSVSGDICDDENGRDHTRAFDSNDRQKEKLIEKILASIRADENLTIDEEKLHAVLKKGPLDDITEYGREVHAEMEALLSCARSNINCRGGTLYCTTFPCHNCAKHIIAAGIERVVYVEPYPKSKAMDFHDDAAFLGFRQSKVEEKKVAFEPFVGVGPRRFFDLFSMRHGSGYPLDRKDKATGEALTWAEKDGILRMPMLPWTYLQREELAAEQFRQYGKELPDGPGQGDES